MFLLIYNKNTNSNIFLKIIKIIPKKFGNWKFLLYICTIKIKQVLNNKIMKKINKILVGLLIASSIVAGFRVNEVYQERQHKTFELRLERAELKHKLDSVMWVNPASEEVSNLYEEYCDLTLKINNIK